MLSLTHMGSEFGIIYAHVFPFFRFARVSLRGATSRAAACVVALAPSRAPADKTRKRRKANGHSNESLSFVRRIVFSAYKSQDRCRSLFPFRSAVIFVHFPIPLGLAWKAETCLSCIFAHASRNKRISLRSAIAYDD